jgi:hypothetical protein
MRVGFPALGAVLVLPAIAGGAVTLFGALLALGVLSGLLAVAMNAQGIEVERRLERPVLSGLHDLWSVGLGIGAGLAALAAGAGIDPPAHFALAGAFVAVVSVASMRGLLAGSGRRSAASGEPAVAARWTPALMLLGAIAFALFVGESAASDWSAVYGCGDRLLRPARSRPRPDRADRVPRRGRARSRRYGPARRPHRDRGLRRLGRRTDSDRLARPGDASAQHWDSSSCSPW